MDEISVPTVVDDTQAISVPMDIPAAVVPPGWVSNNRADKAELGLGDITKMSRREIRDYILTGREQQFRDSAASSISLDNANKKEQALVDAYKQKGSSLSMEEALKVIDPFHPAFKQADVRSVIEENYANKANGIIGTAAAYMNSSTYKNAVDETPETFIKSQSKVSELLSKVEFSRTVAQNVEAEIAGQGMVPWLADQAKSIFQPYNEWKLRGLNPDVGPISGGLLLGNNLKAQADAMFNLPFPEFRNVSLRLRMV